MTDSSKPVKQDIVVRRIVDAPVDLVWKAWTQPEFIRRWWGPKDYAAPMAKVDLREGGMYTFCMEAPPEQGGFRHYSTGVYKKIVEHRLLEFTQFLSDEHGNKVDPASVGMPPDFPAELRMTVEFNAIRADMTELVITEYNWTMGQMAVYSYAGMHQSLDKLQDAVSSE